MAALVQITYGGLFGGRDSSSRFGRGDSSGVCGPSSSAAGIESPRARAVRRFMTSSRA